jgi:hypothetical protein
MSVKTPTIHPCHWQICLVLELVTGTDLPGLLINVAVILLTVPSALLATWQLRRNRRARQLLRMTVPIVTYAHMFVEVDFCYELEGLLRSTAMLRSSSQGLTHEEVSELLRELQDVQRHLDQLKAGLRQLLLDSG